MADNVNEDSDYEKEKDELAWGYEEGRMNDRMRRNEHYVVGNRVFTRQLNKKCMQSSFCACCRSRYCFGGFL